MHSNQHRLIELFFFDAGGGHRNAAMALRESIASLYPAWTVRIVNLQEILEDIDPVRRVSRFQSQDVYNGILKRGWTYGSSAMLRGMQYAIRLLAPLCEERLRTYWRQSRPDMVVSVIPNFNSILFRALRAVHPHTPYVTIMTDLADCPPHFWQELQDQHMICGSEKAIEQAQQLGYREDQLTLTSGMVIKPKFYAAPQTDMTLADLGLDSELPTALVMFGGYASSKAKKIVDVLQQSQNAVQCIVICGHNEKLRRKLNGRPGCHTVGFTNKIPDYMQLADFFIGKPGPGSISEAIQMNLPVIVECNARTMPQERYNAQWLQEHGVGIAIKNLKSLPQAVDQLLDPGMRESWQNNVRMINNQAVFEIPAVLNRLMSVAEVSSFAGLHKVN